MKKNVAGQKIGAQMLTAADGTAFTGAVTVEVTLDAGTQATGTVGSGACTHEGNGYHTYAPSQAETNGDLVAFTFHGTGAVPVTVQVYTAFPQTGDNFALIGATGSGLTSLATQASVTTIDDLLDTEVAAIKTVVDAILVDTGTTLDGKLDTIVSAIDPTGAADLDAIKASTDALTLAAINAQVVDALATDTYPESSGVPAATAPLAVKIAWLCTVARNKITANGTTQTLRNDADSATVATSTVSDDGTTFTRGEWT